VIIARAVYDQFRCSMFDEESCGVWRLAHIGLQRDDRMEMD
jgi:hypothetical protein